MGKGTFWRTIPATLAIFSAVGCETTSHGEAVEPDSVRQEFHALLSPMDRGLGIAQYNILTLVIQPDSSIQYREGEGPVLTTRLRYVPQLVLITLERIPNLIVGVEGHPDAAWDQVFALVEAVREARAKRIFIGLPSLWDRVHPYDRHEILFPRPKEGEVAWLHPGPNVLRPGS